MREHPTVTVAVLCREGGIEGEVLPVSRGESGLACDRQPFTGLAGGVCSQGRAAEQVLGA